MNGKDLFKCFHFNIYNSISGLLSVSSTVAALLLTLGKSLTMCALDFPSVKNGLKKHTLSGVFFNRLEIEMKTQLLVLHDTVAAKL